MSQQYPEPQVIAEIGCNHMGRIEVAFELIELARLCGVQHVKFQKRTPRELLTPEQYDMYRESEDRGRRGFDGGGRGNRDSDGTTNNNSDNNTSGGRRRR